MVRRSQRQSPELELLRNADATCTATFRPSGVSQLVTKGQRLGRDSPIVRQHPEYFALQVPLVEYLEKEKTNGA